MIRSAPPGPESVVEAALASSKLRRTRATVAVLGVFAERPDTALTHADVEQALAATAVAANRVTLYRLLDRLVQTGVLQRTVDAQRLNRFALSTAGPSAPRFECDDCHRNFHVDESPAAGKAAREVLKALHAAGHEALRMDVLIHGRCAGCAAHPAEPAAGR